MAQSTALVRAASAARDVQYLTFTVGEEEYGVDILRVQEIKGYTAITRLPNSPPSIKGVMNLRGTVVPVIDLALRFHLPATSVTRRTCIVIVEVEHDAQRAVMGVLADAVSEVIDLVADQIDEPPQFGTRVHSDFLLGMIRSGRSFVLLLDIDRTLADIDAPAESIAATESVA